MLTLDTWSVSVWLWPPLRFQISDDWEILYHWTNPVTELMNDPRNESLTKKTQMTMTTPSDTFVLCSIMFKNPGWSLWMKSLKCQWNIDEFESDAAKKGWWEGLSTGCLQKQLSNVYPWIMFTPLYPTPLMSAHCLHPAASTKTTSFAKMNGCEPLCLLIY